MLQKEIEETATEKGDSENANLGYHLVVVYQSLIS